MNKMRRITVLLFLLTFVATVAGCNKTEAAQDADSPLTADKLDPNQSKAPPTKAEVNHAFGFLMGLTMADIDFEVSKDDLMKGFEEGLKSKGNIQKQTEMQQVIQRALIEKQRILGLENKKKAEAFLKENATKSGVTVTASGLQYKVVKQGTGKKPQPTDLVKVLYTGKLLDGSVFDSTERNNNQPVEFSLESIIPGWKEGLQLMSVGSTYEFFIPPALAYGSEGYGQVIPPESVLIFTVELLDVKPAPTDKDQPKP